MVGVAVLLGRSRRGGAREARVAEPSDDACEQARLLAERATSRSAELAEGPHLIAEAAPDRRARELEGARQDFEDALRRKGEGDRHFYWLRGICRREAALLTEDAERARLLGDAMLDFREAEVRADHDSELASKARLCQAEAGLLGAADASALRATRIRTEAWAEGRWKLPPAYYGALAGALEAAGNAAAAEARARAG